MWRFVADSAIGVTHQQKNLPCQDCVDCIVRGDYLIGIVADGAGSARLSDIGSRTIVHTVLWTVAQEKVEELEKIVESIDLLKSKSLGLMEKINIFLKRFWELLNQNVWSLDLGSFLSHLFARDVEGSEEINQAVKNFFEYIALVCLDRLELEAQRNNCSLRELASTMLVFIVHPKWLIAGQIGDGILVAREENSEDYELIFKPQRGEFVNETMFLVSEDVVKQIQTVICSKSYRFICAMSDGLERVCIDYAEWKPFSGFFGPLEKCLQQPSLDISQSYIKQFLRSDRLNAYTDDDKSLIIALRES